MATSDKAKGMSAALDRYAKKNKVKYNSDGYPADVADLPVPPEDREYPKMEVGPRRFNSDGIEISRQKGYHNRDGEFIPNDMSAQFSRHSMASERKREQERKGREATYRRASTRNLKD